MALPQLKNDVPKYEMTVPSTGEVVKYRPFLVKEQKVLLVAFESKDSKQILNSMLDSISSCVPNIKLDSFFEDFKSKSINFHTTSYDETLFNLDKSNYDLTGRFDLYTYWYNDIKEKIDNWEFQTDLSVQALNRLNTIKKQCH